MKEPLWKTRDRNPSEPQFTDYTYIFYRGEKFAEVEDTLRYRLTKYLNENEVEISSHQYQLATDAFIEFEQVATELAIETGKMIQQLEDNRNQKIQSLGETIALKLKTKICQQNYNN